MSTEAAKTLLTYLIAAIVILGGGALLVIPTQVDPDQLLPFLTGTVGGVIAYVFADRQTDTVQRGNGFERAQMEELSRQVHDLATNAIPASAVTALTERIGTSAVTADSVEVTGEHVEVRGS